MTTTLTFLGADQTVTGSKHLLTINGRRILIDAGLSQGHKHLRLQNWDSFPIPPSSISDVLLTHAHADHTGYLPRLVKEGLNAKIWCTEGTQRLTEIILRDAGHLQELAAKDAKRGGWSKHANPQPLYTVADVECTLSLFHKVDFDTIIDLGDGISASWTHAGHILGSASIRISIESDHTSIIFSGDLGRHDHPILKPRHVPNPADYVVMEATYGNREHPEVEVPHELLAEAICRTIARGGQVLIPAFAVDRTQTVLRCLVQLYRDARIPKVPVLVDSPMALRTLDVYRDTYLHELRKDISVDDFLGLPELIDVPNANASKQLSHYTEPLIIISSSGMAEGGRVLYHLKHLLPNPKNCVIFVGYQARGTRGHDLQTGARNIKIMGEYIPVKAEIVSDKEFSVHADASDLIDWLKELGSKIPPKTVFLVHGEPEALASFALRVTEELGFTTVVPKYGEVVRLTSNNIVDLANDSLAGSN